MLIALTAVVRTLPPLPEKCFSGSDRSMLSGILGFVVLARPQEFVYFAQFGFKGGNQLSIVDGREVGVRGS
jgi:hypothetical protein